MSSKKDFTGVSAASMNFISGKKQPKEQKAAAGLPEIPDGYKIVRDNKSIRFSLLIRPFVKEHVKREAEEMGITMNELINRILEDRYTGGQTI